jgi:hypothetical protein
MAARKKPSSSTARPEQEPSQAPVGIPQQVPLAYADAVGNVIVGPINTRLTFVINVGPAKDGLQPTAPTLEVVIPTPALIGFLSQMRMHLNTQAPRLMSNFDSIRQQLAEFTGANKPK